MSGRIDEWRGRGEACVLAWAAGLMFIIEGFHLLVATTQLPFASVAPQSAGVISALVGLTLIFLGGFYRSYADARAYFGTLAVLVSVGGIWFGGGFWVGSIVGTIAGGLILALPPYGLTHEVEQAGIPPP